MYTQTQAACDFVTRPMGNYRFRYGPSTDYYHNNDKGVCVCVCFVFHGKPRRSNRVTSVRHVRRRSDVAGPPSYINIDPRYGIKRCGRPLRSPYNIHKYTRNVNVILGRFSDLTTVRRLWNNNVYWNCKRARFTQRSFGRILNPVCWKTQGTFKCQHFSGDHRPKNVTESQPNAILGKNPHVYKLTFLFLQLSVVGMRCTVLFEICFVRVFKSFFSTTTFQWQRFQTFSQLQNTLSCARFFDELKLHNIRIKNYICNGLRIGR